MSTGTYFCFEVVMIVSASRRNPRASAWTPSAPAFLSAALSASPPTTVVCSATPCLSRLYRFTYYGLVALPPHTPGESYAK